jgi:hypothetical protein
MRIHGEWEISLVGNVLVRSTAGQFNIEGTKACFLESQNNVPKNKSWAYLGNASNWEMTGSDSFQLFPNMFEWAFNNGCVCGAVVMPNIIHKKIYEQIAKETTGDKFRYFKTLVDASEWLTSKGYPLTPEDYPHYEFIERTKIETDT